MAVGEQAVVAHPHETARHDMEEEAAEKLGRLDAQFLDAAPGVQVDVIDERLRPRVQHGVDADLGPEVARVAGEGLERRGARVEEDRIEVAGVRMRALRSWGTVKTTWK